VQLYPFFNFGARWELDGKLYTPIAFTPWKETRYSLYRRLGGPEGRSVRVRKISPPQGFDLRTVQPVASRYSVHGCPSVHDPNHRTRMLPLDCHRTGFQFQFAFVLSVILETIVAL
jgi:hypothetical protein